MPHKDPARARAKRLETYQKKRATRIEASRQWAIRNRDRRRAYDLAYRTRNGAKRLEQIRAWRLRNPKRYKAWARIWYQKYRAAKRSATINSASIRVFVQTIMAKRTAVCYYCRRRVSVKQIEFDHMIALANGGAHSVENLCTACKRCNRQKGARSLQRWFSNAQPLLNL